MADKIDEKFFEDYFRESAEAIQQVNPADMKKAVDILFEAWKGGKQVFVMGNGGSASTATHFTCDLLKPTHQPGKNERFRAICLNDNIPVMSAWVNDVGWDHLYTGQLEHMMNPGDVLVGFSVHGGSIGTGEAMWSQNMPKAIRFAKERGAKTIGIAGFDGGAMKQLCDVTIIVPKDSTPHVEGLHLVVHHAIMAALKEKMGIQGKHK
jgi:D-sedoheptulose 7-phosphate isomerase